MRKNYLSLALLAGLLSSPTAFALDPFRLKIDVGADSTIDGVAGFSNFGSAISFVELRNFSGGAYDGTQALFVDLSLRGLGTTLAFAANSAVLEFTVSGLARPDGGSTASFSPTSDPQTTSLAEQRAESLQQLRIFLKRNPGIRKAIYAALVKNSPIDPLAGNPDSLFGRKMRSDMDYGFTHKVSQVWGCSTSAFNMSDDAPILIAAIGPISDIFAEAQGRAAALQSRNEYGAGLSLSSATASTPDGDYKTTALLVPLSYTVKLDAHPTHKIRIDLPIGYTDTQGATGYSVGLGVAYTYPVSDVWTLTPAYGIGATHSEDLLSAGGVNSFSVTSAYTWRLSDYALSLGNSIGMYDSLDLKLGDIEAGADIRNTAFSNGLILTGPNSLIAKNLVVEYSFMNTQIRGDEVYTDQYNEIGVSVGHLGLEMGIIRSYLKFGIGFLKATGDGGEIKATKLNFAARF